MNREDIEAVVDELNDLAFKAQGESTGQPGELGFSIHIGGDVCTLLLNQDAIWDDGDGREGIGDDPNGNELAPPLARTQLLNHVLKVCEGMGRNLMRMAGVKPRDEAIAAKLIERWKDPTVRGLAAPASREDERQKRWLEDLTRAVNCNSRENGSNTPDFILGQLLADVTAAFDKATRARDRWYEGSTPPIPPPDGASEPGNFLTLAELKAACKNVGVHLECGACAELFYTGMTTNEHTCDHGGVVSGERLSVTRRDPEGAE